MERFHRLAESLIRLHAGDFERRYGAALRRSLEDEIVELGGASPYRRRRVATRLLLELAWSAACSWFDRRPRRHADRGLSREVSGLGADLRYALRALRAKPGFTALAIALLAAGLGGSLAAFSVVDAVLLRPLPFPEPDRIVRLWTVLESEPAGRMSTLDLRDIESAPGIEIALGYSAERFTLSGLGEAELIQAAVTSGPLLSLFGLEVVRGRDFGELDGRPDGEPLMVIGHGFWRTRLGSDPEALGRTLRVDGIERRIIGIAPPGFDFPLGAEVWIPLAPPQCGSECRVFAGIGRLRAGETLPAVRAEALAVAERLRGGSQAFDGRRGFEIESLHDDLVGEARPGLQLLLASVLIVLTIAGANVAGLQLVRGAQRGAELSIRAALGAGRARIVRQLLLESALLATGAGLLGVSLARLAVEPLLALAPSALSGLSDPGLDPAILAFAAATILATTLLSGLLPALRLAGRTDARIVTRTVAGSADDRSGSVLLTLEVALSLVLVLGAMLLVSSFVAKLRVDPGFETEERVQFVVDLPFARYPDGPAIVAAFDRLMEELRSVSGVRDVTGVFGSPLDGIRLPVLHTLHDRPGESAMVLTRVAALDYFRFLGVPLIAGRTFSAQDHAEAPGVAIVSRSFAEQMFPDGDVLGSEITPELETPFGPPSRRRIVGVVEDIRSASLVEPPQPEVYLAQAQTGFDYLTVIVRSDLGAVALRDAVQAIVRRVDPTLALHEFRTMESMVARELATTRFYLSLLACFAAAAVGLAAVGLYGVVAQGVIRRRRELAIRIALGARTGAVVAAAVRRVVVPIVVGIATGVLAAWTGAHLLASLLYETDPRDPWGYLVASAIVLAISVAAATVPARRALAIQPLETLGSD